MLSQRTIEKRVQEELARDERWKVIVRGNNWLCPYCGRIGARDLKMDEAIESKIAEHLAKACDRWDYFKGEALTIDRLRQRAKLIVFKVRLGRWIVDDRRFRLFVGDGSPGQTHAERLWLCPFCARDTEATAPSHDLEDAATWEHPREEDPFIDAIARHLLACADFARGEDRLRPARELEERVARLGRARTSEKIRGRFEREPSFRLVDEEHRWVCPFCAQPTDLLLEGAAGDGPPPHFFEGIESHLLLCKAYKLLDGKPRPVNELKGKLQGETKPSKFSRVRDKINKHPIWRARDLEGLWYCPYCAQGTTIRYPEKAKALPEPEKSQSIDRFVGRVIEHLQSCASYGAKDSKVQSKAQMARVLSDANARISSRRRIRQKLTGDEVFGVTDEVGDWVCPYCQRAQKKIHLYQLQESAVFEKTVEQVVAHLEDECEAYTADAPPRTTRPELERAARGRPSLRASGVTDARVVPRPSSRDGEQDWARIKKEIEDVRSRVEVSRRRDLSLKEARSKQLRLLPEMPQLPGYEFGCVYRPCDAIGGDFYDIFKAGDGTWGFAIGDISGHGIEAALLMGLAKKLLEVHGRGRTSAAESLVLANADIFPDLDEKTFVTVFFGLLDTGTRVFKFSRAGHSPPILFNPQRTPPLQIHDSKGMALGMDAGPIFQESIEELEVTLRPGDLVLQYTDGVIEAMNERREEFGGERLNEIVRTYGHNEAEYVLWRIEKAVDEWLGGREPQDDITMIAFKVLG